MREAGKLTENYKVASAWFRVNTDSEPPFKFWRLQEDIIKWRAIKLKFLPSSKSKIYLGKKVA